MKIKLLLTILFTFTLFTAPVIAQTPTPTPTTLPTEERPSIDPETQDSYLRSLERQDQISEAKAAEDNNRFFAEFMNMLATLGVIIALILIVTWLLKRLLNTRIQQANNTSMIKIIERRSLTPKSALYLLDIMGKGIVIAETPNGVSLVTELPNAKLTDTSSSFDTILQEKMNKDKKP